MHSAIALFTTIAFVSSACAPLSAPARDATSAPPVTGVTASSPDSAPPAAARPPVAYAASETQPVPEPTPATTKVPNDARGDEAMPRALGWFSVGLGVSSAIVAVGTSIMMVSEASTRGNDCSGKLCSSAGITANNQLQGLAGWNAASYVVAAAGIGIGAYLLITNPANAEKQTAIGVAPTSSGAGLVLRSTF
jgi:hypothetical protein